MALNYLLSPTFQAVSTAGKPLTGGYIETYLAGTRTKYFCASDFSGTLHPFKIPLDALGSNIVLADDGQSYDVYIYNRYGSLSMSRYNVNPSEGGGVSTTNITSTDGTITVTDTAGGVDLSVNGAIPSVLRASGNTLTSDGSFTCLPRQKSGNKVIVDQNGKVKIEQGWYHYDIVTHFDYSGTPTNQTVVVALRQGVLESRKEVDLSYPNEGTIALSAEIYNSSLELEEFDISVSGIPDGMSVELVELGIHSIVGHGAGGGGASYTAGSGIEIIDDEISVDTSVVATQTDLESKQDTLTAGDNISIVDNVISATAAPQVNADWNATSGVAEILNKPIIPVVPEMKELVAGTNVTITESANSVTISAAGSAQVNSDWNATSGVAEILNKPTIPVIPAMKDLVAGSGVTITEGQDSVTISAAGTSYTAGTGIEILNDVISADTTVLALKSELHTIGTITL